MVIINDLIIDFSLSLGMTIITCYSNSSFLPKQCVVVLRLKHRGESEENSRCKRYSVYPLLLSTLMALLLS